jgi:hypothetical protein
MLIAPTYTFATPVLGGNAAKALGLIIPGALLALADEVSE